MICRDQASVNMWDVCMPRRDLRCVEDILCTGHYFWCTHVCLCVHVFVLLNFFCFEGHCPDNLVGMTL